ncbi:MAG: carboxypeptidase-like regulatory domain-containing protein, partial [Bacteroidales bacterium]|nr:carboxypeptidase-like regulatory domain-containing protein [Bacteroidales bacterium]
MNKNWLFLLLLCLVSVPSYSQMTRVRGAVTDAVTGEPVPFVSVYFKNTTIGISTDLEGRYYIETADTAARVLTASILGYSAQERPVSRGSFNEIDFVLEPYSDELRSAVVKPDNRRIRRILDALDRSRARNDYEMDRKWATRCYVKTELDATHAEELVSSALFRNALESTIQYRDTSVVTGQTFIPILFSETISERTHGVVGD